MRVEGGVPRGTRQVFVLSVRYVYVRPLVDVALGQAEVDDVDEVALLAEAHEEVVGFDVPVDQVPGVGVLDPGDLRERRTRVSVASAHVPCDLAKERRHTNNY